MTNGGLEPSVHYGRAGVSQCEFSADGSLWAFSHGEDPKNRMVTMFDTQTGRVLWERRGVIHFLVDPGLVLFRNDQANTSVFLDAHTGEPNATTPIEFMWTSGPALTADGRHFLIRG